MMYLSNKKIDSIHPGDVSAQMMYLLNCEVDIISTYIFTGVM